MEESPFRSLRSFLACIKPVGSFWKAITFSVLELILAFAPSMPLWEEKIVGRIIVEYILALRIDAWAKY